MWYNMSRGDIVKNSYYIENGVCFINGVCRGEQVEILVDLDILDKLKFHSSTIHVTKTKSGGMYAYLQWQVQRKRLTTQLHHVIMGLPEKGFVVDHKNRNGLDNRRDNLHIISEMENHWNTSLGGKSQNGKHSTGHRNISYGKFNRKMCYRVKVLRNGKEQHLGFFDKLDDAIKARDTYLNQKEVIE
jgi:hypothetical protein